MRRWRGLSDTPLPFRFPVPYETNQMRHSLLFLESLEEPAKDETQPPTAMPASFGRNAPCYDARPGCELGNPDSQCVRWGGKPDIS